MALNRDLSVLLVEAVARRKGREIDVADALAGTGARSVRLAHEVDARVIVHANDAMPEAVAAIRRTAQANGVEAALRVTQSDAHLMLAQQRYDVVDLDPCGSPMPFLDAAVRAARHDGYVCVTATDTGALAGTYPRACRRRYDAHHGLHAFPWRAEVGLRILGGCIVRSAARFDRVATPVLSVAHGHWTRVVAHVADGKRDADAAVAMLRMAVPDAEGRAGWTDASRPAPPGGWAGPLWSGPLHEPALLDGIQAASAGKALQASTLDVLGLLRAEAGAPPFWFVPELARGVVGQRMPRRDPFIAALRERGVAATRTHLDARGVRTDADAATLRAAAAAALA